MKTPKIIPLQKCVEIQRFLPKTYFSCPSQIPDLAIDNRWCW